NLERQLNKETLHEKDSNSDLRVIKVQFDQFIHSKVLEPSNYNSYDLETRQDFKEYTQMEPQTFKDAIIQNMDSIEQCIIQKCKVHEVKTSDASSGDKDCNRIVSDKGNDQGLENQCNTFGDESSMSRNECNDKSTSGDDTNIRPSYDTEPMVVVPYTAEYNVFAVDTQHFEQPECIINTCVVEKVDSNVIPDSLNMCDNKIQTDQNVVECDNERAALANLIANLKLDIDENKKIQKQLKKANVSLTHELKECKSTLAETSRTLKESNSIWDSCLIALQHKQTELEKYMTFNDRTVDYDKLEHKLNETLGLLAQKEIDIKEGLKLKAYEISVVKEKHDELVKHSLLTKSHYEGLVKDKTKVITDLKLKEEKDIDKMISMERQLKFLNEIIYKRNQSIQTIHMLAPKGPTFNGRPIIANLMYLKKAQFEKPCLYAIPYDQYDPANRLVPDREETLTIEKESRSKLNKDKVKPYDYTKLNNLEYVKSLEKEIDKIESDKANFSNTYDLLLQECVSNDVMCSYLHSLSDLDAHSELQCLYLHKVKECEFCKEKASNVFQKEREQYFKIHDLKAQLQDKNIAKSELKKLIDKCKGKSMETKFDKPSVVRQPNAQRIPKPSVLGKPAPFSDSLERKTRQAVRNTNVVKPGMYQIDTSTTQTRAPHLPQTSRNTNPRVSTSTRVIHNTNFSRPQLRSTQMKDKVMPNNSQVKDKKTKVEDHPRISSISNKTKFVTASNDSLKSKTSNVNVVCATCGKCVFNSNHDACVSKYLNDVNARTKKPKVVPISTKKPKSQANKSVETPPKKTIASDPTITNSKSYYRMIYEKTSKAWKWWIEQQCPSGYKWVPKIKMKWVPKVRNENVQKRVSLAIDNTSRITNIVQLILFIVDSGCTKHMTGNLTLLVYYVEGLNHNLFSVGQFCDADLEVAFRKSTCFVRDLQGNDLLTGNCGSDLYIFSLQETTSSTLIYLMAKASPTQAWLWHRRLSHLNFDYNSLLSKKDVVIGLPKLKYVKDQLCSSCEMSKAKRSSFKTKIVPSSKGRLNLLHMDLCGPMRVANINRKKYIMVTVDNYSRYTWTLFLQSKDETPEVLKDFLTMIQQNLQAPVISIRTDKGTEFLNKTLHAFFKEEGIEHQTSTPRTPE
ncbi:retrovirus-related pol polyprotein from transposon TNT 1-94, partial [Tanacetum coccineum]